MNELKQKIIQIIIEIEEIEVLKKCYSFVLGCKQNEKVEK